MRILASSAAFILGMILGWLVIGVSDSAQEIPQVSAQIRSMHRCEQVCDTAFVGSSRIRRQISPVLFDEQMLAAGQPTHSINLGVDAMAAPELLKFCQEIMPRGTHLMRQWIIDLNALRRTIPPAPNLSREIWWHDFHHTVIALRALATHPVPPPASAPASNLSLATSHLLLMLQHYARRGEGAALFNRAIFPLRPMPEDEAENRGYYPESGSLSATLRESFASELGAMKAQPRIQIRDSAMDDFYRELSALAGRENIRLVFVLMPVISLKRPPLPPPDVLSRHSLLAFDDPVKFPELYRPEDRYDLQHFNVAGSVVFTTVLTREMTAEIPQARGNN